MELDVITRQWLILAALGLAVPFIAVTGLRLVAYRLVGRPETLPDRIDSAPVIPVPHFASRWQAIRSGLLVAMLGLGLAIILLRFIYGLGAVTNLSDRFPWGLWIGFDVMTGVALAAGAFVITATVHIFGLKRFEPLVRPAVLTGLLGYLLVIGGLMVDLGRPYNVWRPLVHWQHHSVLWEVGLCVTFYTLVLFIEFQPVVLERLNRFSLITDRLPTISLYRWLKKVSIIFVILGVVLSTMHQSSLGSLYVLLPTKLSPLWYSLYLPVFFWISAVAAGLTVPIIESTLSAKAFKRGLELNLLADLARTASVVLLVYLLVRAGDLAARGAWPLLFEPTLQAATFWAEIGLGVIVPAVLFALKPLRYRPRVLFSGAVLMIIFGVVLNRLNVSWIGLLPYTGAIYYPSWMEVVVSLTLVSLGVIAFGLAAKYLPVFSEHEPA